MDVGDTISEQREMPLGLADLGFDARDVRGEPAAVGRRHHQVLGALEEKKQARAAMQVSKELCEAVINREQQLDRAKKLSERLDKLLKLGTE